MKQVPGSLTMLCMALWLVLSQTHYASAQEVEGSSEADSKPVPWASSLVSVRESAGAVANSTGVVVKAESDTALVLTTFQQLPNAEEPLFSPYGKEMMVSIKAKDGRLHEIKGTVTSMFGQFPSASGAIWHTAFVEVKHNGLKLAAVPIAENVPGKDTSLTVVGRHCPDSTPSANLQNAKLISEIDPATSHDLRGQLSGTSLLPESLLTVHDEKGALVGIGSLPNMAGMGGGGFGGGGGFFSVPDPFNNGFSEIEPQPISFVSVVDRAESLREMGVPVSDAAIKLQKQRLRINKDAFGRPIQGVNLQITWSDDHKELHGFSTTRGEWTKLSIKEQDVIIPIVGKNVGAVSLDGKIAAYSPEAGQWDVMTLRPGSQVPPSISTDVVTVRDGKDYYTFAASSGIWTSPTNADYQKHSISLQISNSAGFKKLQEAMRVTNNRAVAQTQGRGLMTISGPRHHVLAAEILAKEALKVPRGFGADELTSPLGLGKKTGKDAGPGVLPPVISSVESESLNIAKQLRDASQTGEPDKTSLQKLRKLVAESFDQRLQKQKAAAAELKKKLQAIETAVQSREVNRERIIERRVEELLDPNIDWATLQPNSSSARVSGLPVTGSPIGLPGPANIALGPPGPDHVAVGSSAKDLKDPNSTDRDVSKLLESLKTARATAVDVHAHNIEKVKLQLAEFQRPIKALQQVHGNAFTAKDQETAIQSSQFNLKVETESFETAFVTWQSTWRRSERQLETKQLDVEDSLTRIELTEEKLKLISAANKKGYVSSIEVKELETQLKLQKTELQRAKIAFESIARISKDFPELDPASFDTSELLGKQTSRNF